MKKTSRINLFTTLLFFSHNASAIDEFCHLETDENYSLSEEATDCFSGTWTKFLNEKKDADHQTFFSLDEIGQQIIGEKSRTNDEVPNPDFSVHDSRQQYGKPSGFLTETSDNNNSLPLNHRVNSFSQQLDVILDSPINHGPKENTRSTDNSPSISERTHNKTTAASKNDRNGSGTEHTPYSLPLLHSPVEYNNLETDENYSLSEETTDCFSEAWTKILNGTGNADDQTFFSLDGTNQQITGETEKTNNEVSDQSSSVLFEVPNPDFSAHDPGQQYTQPSDFFTETSDTNNSQPLSHGVSSSPQLRDDIFYSPINYSPKENTRSTDNSPSFSETTRNHTTAVNTNDSNGFSAEPNPFFPSSLGKRTPPESNQLTMEPPLKKAKIHKNGYGHLSKKDKTELDKVIENNPNMTSKQIREYVKKNFNTEITNKALHSFFRRGKQKSTSVKKLSVNEIETLKKLHEENPHAKGEAFAKLARSEGIELNTSGAKTFLLAKTPAASPKNLTDEQKEILTNYIQKHPDATPREIAEYARNSNINLNYYGARLLKNNLMNQYTSDFLKQSHKAKIIEYIKENPKAKGKDIARFVKEELAIDIEPLAALQLQKKVKRPSDSYKDLDKNHRETLTNYIKENPTATGKLISQFGKRNNINISINAAHAFKISVNRKK